MCIVRAGVLLVEPDGTVAALSSDLRKWAFRSEGKIGSTLGNVLEGLPIGGSDRKAIVNAWMAVREASLLEQEGQASWEGDSSRPQILHWVVSRVDPVSLKQTAIVLALLGPAGTDSAATSPPKNQCRSEEDHGPDVLKAGAGLVLAEVEKERRKLAQEIHDEIGQTFVLLTADLEHVRERLATPAGPPAEWKAVDTKLEDALRTVGNGMTALRRVITALCPPVLHELGLAAAVEWQVRMVARRLGIRHTLDIGAIGDVPPDLATAVYRVLQECLNNIARHARASRISVTLHRQGDILELEVRDDGRGFTLDEVSTKGGIGIPSMKERASACGGNIEILADPKKGTAVRGQFPIGMRDAQFTARSLT